VSVVARGEAALEGDLEGVQVGLVECDVEAGPPVSVTYRLTARGQGLGPAMDALRVWAGAPTDSEGNALPYSAMTHQSVEA
jgi:DNA-binding HxlR family transcriptional regulator